MNWPHHLSQTQQNHPASDEAHRFQYSLRTALFAVVYLSLVLGSVRMVWLLAERMDWYPTILGLFYPGWLGLCSLGVLLAAGCRLRATSDSDSIWSAIALAWLMVAANWVYGIMQAFTRLGCHGGWSMKLYYGLFYATVSAITLPMLLTAPLIYVLIEKHRSKPTAIGRLPRISFAVAMIDVALIAAFTWTLANIWEMSPFYQ